LRENIFVTHKFFAEQLRNQVTRDVVGSRAEPAGDDHQIRAGQGFSDGLLDVARRVRHGNLPRDDVAKIGEPAAEPLLVRVQNAAQQKFAASVYQFNFHALKFNHAKDA
jgi:hypothetical protein